MKNFSVRTNGRTAFINIDAEVQAAVKDMGIEDGEVTVFIPHTTAGVTINENADPDVLHDIEKILDSNVPWSGGYRHMEGNSAAHVKASLMGFSERILIEGGRLCLGTWQSIYFCEFDGPRNRTVWVK
ncbi:hypothetical protein BVX97_06585 [bacterium E08(2017)]|nr:hypothetical protein BVX97_06585 [bacterium E08(2017)]